MRSCRTAHLAQLAAVPSSTQFLLLIRTESSDIIPRNPPRFSTESAETGLLAGRQTTIHWAFAPTFQRNFPDIGLRLEEVLITAGDPERFVMTGGVFSWHDLALHLITRFVGPSAAQSMARLMLLDWHSQGQAPYVGFLPVLDHGDALILDLQNWLETHFPIANPIDEMSHRCGLSTRSLERRFRKATGLSPLDYVQNIRIEAAKRRLERSNKPLDEITSEVGYENPAFFAVCSNVTCA